MRTSIVLAAALGLAACARPLPPRAPEPSPATVEVERASSPEELLGQALAEVQRHDPVAARKILRRILMVRPQHLESRVVQALADEAAGDEAAASSSWSEVERILIYRGKLQPFGLPGALQAVALHYLKEGKEERSRIFLDELWRRFPTDGSTAKTQLMAAELHFTAQRWSSAVESCSELTRMLPGHELAGRCRRLIVAARRMLELGPEVPASAPSWVWETPLPQGNTLWDVWVTPSGTVYAVGEVGTILRRRRTDREFSVMASPTRWALHRLWGTAEGQLYVVGASGIVLRSDGDEWKVLRPAAPTQADLWGVTLDENGRVVAVGEGGVLLEQSASGWTERRVASSPLRAVWPGASGRLVAAGDGGTLLRREDGQWKGIPSDCYEDLWSIWGGEDQQLILVGQQRTVVHFDGQRAQERVAGRANLRDVWGTNKEAWAVGTGGDIVRYASGTWQLEPSGTLMDLHGVAGRGGEVWAVGAGGTILSRRSGRWTPVVTGAQQGLAAISAGRQSYALGDRGMLLRRSKGRWQTEGQLPPGRYRDLWTDGQRFAAVGDRGLLVVRDGRGPWTVLPSNVPEDLLSVSGWDGGFVAVGTRGTVLRRAGGDLVQDALPTGLDLHGVWAVSARQIFAVGVRGSILRFDGQRWTEEESGSLADLHSVWAPSPQLAIVVGAGGTILRLERGRWSPMSSPLPQNLVDLWGSSPEHLLAVSDRGSIIEFDGIGWSLQRSPASCLSAIAGSAVTGPLAVGCYGSVLRLKP